MDYKEAMFWKHEYNKIRCELCPQYCLIGEGQYGLCRTRKNENNKLYAVNYGEVTSLAMDPIEKKPFYHVHPGSKILSVGTFGCNMKCQFCQNYTISQNIANSEFMSSDELVDLILRIDNNIGVSFTYNEPFMWYETVYDVAKKLKTRNSDKMFVIVTNGYINSEPLKQLLPYIDALNIDLKAFSQSFYHQICKASLEPVLKTIELTAHKCHVEVTTLMVTDENDSIEEIESISQFISQIDKDIPLHLSRYFPNYKMNNAPTDITKMKAALKVAKKHLNYVYLGNIPHGDANIYCPHCGRLFLDRRNTVYPLENKCEHCGKEIKML